MKSLIEVSSRSRADPPVDRLNQAEFVVVSVEGGLTLELGVRCGEHVPYLRFWDYPTDQAQDYRQIALYSPDLRDAIVFRKSPSSVIYHALDCNNIPNDAKVILWQAIKALQDQDKENS